MERFGVADHHPHRLLYLPDIVRSAWSAHSKAQQYSFPAMRCIAHDHLVGLHSGKWEGVRAFCMLQFEVAAHRMGGPPLAELDAKASLGSADLLRQGRERCEG